jgi:hypothetical protein
MDKEPNHLSTPLSGNKGEPKSPCVSRQCAYNSTVIIIMTALGTSSTFYAFGKTASIGAKRLIFPLVELSLQQKKSIALVGSLTLNSVLNTYFGSKVILMFKYEDFKKAKAAYLATVGLSLTSSLPFVFAAETTNPGLKLVPYLELISYLPIHFEGAKLYSFKLAPWLNKKYRLFRGLVPNDELLSDEQKIKIQKRLEDLFQLATQSEKPTFPKTTFNDIQFLQELIGSNHLPPYTPPWWTSVFGNFLLSATFIGQTLLMVPALYGYTINTIEKFNNMLNSILSVISSDLTVNKNSWTGLFGIIAFDGLIFDVIGSVSFHLIDACYKKKMPYYLDCLSFSSVKKSISSILIILMAGALLMLYTTLGIGSTASALGLNELTVGQEEWYNNTIGLQTCAAQTSTAEFNVFPIVVITLGIFKELRKVCNKKVSGLAQLEERLNAINLNDKTDSEIKEIHTLFFPSEGDRLEGGGYKPPSNK